MKAQNGQALWKEWDRGSEPSNTALLLYSLIFEIGGYIECWLLEKLSSFIFSKVYQFWAFNGLRISLLPKTANSQQIWFFWSLFTPKAKTLPWNFFQVGKNDDICGCLHWAETTCLQAKDTFGNAFTGNFWETFLYR